VPDETLRRQEFLVFRFYNALYLFHGFVVKTMVKSCFIYLPQGAVVPLTTYWNPASDIVTVDC
jgi:hypothetical protein